MRANSMTARASCCWRWWCQHGHNKRSLQ